MQQNKKKNSDKLGRYYTKSEISLILKEALSCKNVSNLLDLGSGEGALSLPLMECFYDANCTTVDIDTETKFSVDIRNHTHYKQDASDPHFFVNNNIEESSFDVALCNPPFINLELNHTLLDFLKQNKYPLKSFQRKYISAEVIFVIHSINALVDGGVLGLIVPDGFISGEKYRHFREYLNSKGSISKVIKLPRTAFENTDVQAHILVFVKNITLNEIKISKYLDGSLHKAIYVPRESGIESLDYDMNIFNSPVSKATALTIADMNCLISRGKQNSKQCKELLSPVFHTTSFEPKKNRIIFSNRPFENMDLQSVVIAEKGDILIARVGKKLSEKVVIVDGGYSIISDCILRVRAPVKYREQLFSYLNSPNGRKKIDSHIIGASARYLTKSSLMKLSIPIHPEGKIYE